MNAPVTFEHTPPVGVKWHDFASGPIEGIALTKENAVIASVSPSGAHPGYFDISVIEAAAGCATEMRRPVRLDGVQAALEFIIWPLGVRMEDFAWKKTVRPPAPVSAAKPEAERPFGPVVYFFRAGEFIKIGKATGSPENRVASLRTGCPFPIEVLGFIPGDLGVEAAWHRRFGHLRAHGEWFHAAPDLCGQIERQLAEAAP